jgi:hypothetical protein
MLNRTYISHADNGPYYRLDDGLPILEFSPSMATDWEGRPALMQGRIWGAFEAPSQKYRLWYEAIVRWIRKGYIRYGPLSGYISPAVRAWHNDGGVLLPMFRPPTTDAWRAFVAKQPSAVVKQ